jgi:hypothetical protein
MTTTNHALAAGSNAPTNEEARLQPGPCEALSKLTTDCAGSLTTRQAGTEDLGLRFAGFRAFMSKAGYGLVKDTGLSGPWTIRAQRQGRARRAHGLTACGQFADRVGTPL